MLEPRRIAARAAARRMAEESGWTLGGEVGYQVRFERRAGRETRILVVTEGILVRMLQADPFLEGVGAVVFDEFHERSLQTRPGARHGPPGQREVRPDLRLLAMSATLDPGPVAAFLGGCPDVESRGRLYPVEIRYVDRAGRRGRLAGQIAAGRAPGARRQTPGDVLVFLPGVGEIQRSAEALAGSPPSGTWPSLPLYGDLPAEQQDAVLRPAGRRKVVLATNVAETSVTVDGVTAVVDTGLVRRLRFDPATGLDRLELGRISRASADQRPAAPAARRPASASGCGPPGSTPTLPERETPEIGRVDLAGPALQLLAWGETDLAAFAWFEAPDPAALAARPGCCCAELGAVGRPAASPRSAGAMARLPVHPRLGRLLVEGHRAAAAPGEAALLAALLAERDPFPREGAGGRPAAAPRAPTSSTGSTRWRLSSAARLRRDA